MQQIDGKGDANYYVDSSDIHESQDQGNVFELHTPLISIHSWEERDGERDCYFLI